MDHVYWVVDGLLAGRRGPVSAPWDLEELHQGGVRTIVSMSEEVIPPGVEAAGMSHQVFPLPPVLCLSDEDVDVLLAGVEAALPAILAEIESGRPVLVHCWAGKDRTGVTLAAFLIRYGSFTAVEAIAWLRAQRPDAMSASGYEEAVRVFAEREAQAA